MTKKFKRVFKKMLENAESRVVLFHIMVTAGTFLHGFVPGDSHATSFHTGQRSICSSGTPTLKTPDEHPL